MYLIKANINFGFLFETMDGDVEHVHMLFFNAFLLSYRLKLR